MTMHIELSPEMESFIRGKVAAGAYGNPSDVVSDAIRRMQSEDDRMQAWRAAVRKGDEELERGEGLPYTASVLKAITEEAVGAIGSAKLVDPDVLA